MILPNLLLQKPSRTSKAKDHLQKLVDRLNLWKKGEISDLLRECRDIQKKVQSSKRRSSEDSARIFSKLMMQGKINAALKFLSSDADNGVLELTDETMNSLAEKHPEPSSITEDALLHGPIDKTLTSHFYSIDEEMIAKAARLTKGAGEPSQLDAYQYRQ